MPAQALPRAHALQRTLPHHLAHLRETHALSALHGSGYTSSWVPRWSSFGLMSTRLDLTKHTACIQERQGCTATDHTVAIVMQGDIQISQRLMLHLCVPMQIGRGWSPPGLAMTSLQNMGYGSETLDIYMPSSRTEGVYTTRVSSDAPCALPPPTRYTLHGRIHACSLKTSCAAKFEASLLPTSQVADIS